MRASRTWSVRALVALALFALVSYFNAYVCDDAFITLRTLDNFVRGEGLRWNVEERVQVFTSPLHTLLLSVPYWIFHDRGPDPNPDRAYWVLIFYSFVVSSAMIVWLARELSGARFWFVFSLLMASQAFVAFTSSGLETSQTYLLTAVFYTRFLRQEVDLSPRGITITFLLAALAVLNRLDAAVLFLIPCIYVLWQALRARGVRALIYVLPGACLLVAWFTFALVYFGFLLPNTYYAKVGLDVATSVKFGMGWSYLQLCLRYDTVTLVVSAAALAVCWKRARTLVCGLSAAAYILYVVSIGGDFLGWRFLAPPFLISVLLLQSVLADRFGARVKVWATPGIAGALFYAILMPASPLRTFRELPRHPDVYYYFKASSVARWRPGMTFPFDKFLTIEDHCACVDLRPDEFTVAVWASGLNGFCRGPRGHLLDPHGITDPLLARITVPMDGPFRPGHAKRPLPVGYIESVVTQENRIVDPALAAYYDKLRSIVSGPLFARERWRNIWELNFTDESRFRGSFASIDHPLPAKWARTAGTRRSSSEPLSVLMIVVDTLRADHLGVYGYERRTSPAIDRWSRRGLVFEQAQASSSWTLPSVASLLTGLPPSRHTAGVERDANGSIVPREQGGKSFRLLPDSVDTVAETLARSGYATAAFVTNRFLDLPFGLMQGFEHFDHHGEARAEEVVDAALIWLAEERSAPDFAYVHLFDPHLPYDAGAPFAGRFTTDVQSSMKLPVRGIGKLRERAASLAAADRDFIVAAYDEEVAYVDQQIGRLFAALEEQGALDSTLVILTSDHGEELFDHAGFEHGHTMFQELLHVPLIVWHPDLAPGRVATPVSLLDVTATILAAANARPQAPAAGRSLLVPVAPAEIVSEGNLYGPARRALLSWPHKLIAGPELQVFDLSTDTAELFPLSDDSLRARMTVELDERIEAARALAPGATEAELDVETLERLRELGYVD